MADTTDQGFAHLHIPASELREGDVIAHGFTVGNMHYVETVGHVAYEGREFIAYTGRNGRGDLIDATVLTDLMLDVRRNLNL